MPALKPTRPSSWRGRSRAKPPLVPPPQQPAPLQPPRKRGASRWELRRLPPARRLQRRRRPQKQQRTAPAASRRGRKTKRLSWHAAWKRCAQNPRAEYPACLADVPQK